MLEKETLLHPIPAPPSRIPRPLAWRGGPTLGLSKVSPSRECPGHFRPPTPPSFPWPLGALQFHLPWVSPSAPPRPRHPPRGHVLPADPFAGQYNSPADRRRHPLLHPCFWKQISPLVLRGDGLDCLLLPHLPPIRQAGPEGRLCGWGLGDTR